GQLTEDWRAVQPSEESARLIHPNTLVEMEPPPYDLPPEWRWKPLDLLCSRITDGEHLTPPRSDSGIPILSAKDVREDGVDFGDVKFVSSEVAERSRQRCN